MNDKLRENWEEAVVAYFSSVSAFAWKYYWETRKAIVSVRRVSNLGVRDCKAGILIRRPRDYMATSL
jgi:hypothetical protein